MQQLAREVLRVTKSIHSDLLKLGYFPDEGLLSQTQQVLPRSLVRGTRGYIEKVVNQINGCYERGWFDACAVMIRRLLETLLIEAFEHQGKTEKVKMPTGEFMFLGDLIDVALSESDWNLGRNARRALSRLKNVGDQSAHSRRFIARKWDIDRVMEDLRVVTEELLFLAGLR